VVSYYSDVCDFFDKFKVPKGTTPHIPDLESYQFRYKFMAEELEEFNRAFEESDLSGMADALVDLVYVALGTALVMGIPFDECWREVQAANMRKVRANGADDERSKRKHLLDVVKPEGWKPPDVAGVLLRAGLKKISTDRRGMDLARTAAQWSKDPTTKVGAAIVGEDPRRTSSRDRRHAREADGPADKAQADPARREKCPGQRCLRHPGSHDVHHARTVRRLREVDRV
jgi:predicted HAD superfamily Cof-like phosphohydrolase